uniref:Putative secreted protein n=1 Tax=Amblyomma cajennense TaxID=34607 RepID=A0A023FB46_AMBCJ
MCILLLSLTLPLIAAVFNSYYNKKSCPLLTVFGIGELRCVQVRSAYKKLFPAEVKASCYCTLKLCFCELLVL